MSNKIDCRHESDPLAITQYVRSHWHNCLSGRAIDLVCNPHTPKSVKRMLSRHPDSSVRYSLAALTDYHELLKSDISYSVRERVASTTFNEEIARELVETCPDAIRRRSASFSDSLYALAVDRSEFYRRHREFLGDIDRFFPIEVYYAVRHYPGLISWSVDEPEKVSYARRPADLYDNRRRVRLSLGKMLVRLGFSAEDFESETFELVSERTFNPEDFEISSRVAYWYERLGTDAESCMIDNPNGCLYTYERNNVSIVVWRESARALFWETTNGEKFIDRIYPNSGPHIEVFKRWADANGYLIRPNHSAGVPNIDLEVRFSHTGPMPFLDTFAYWSDGYLNTVGDGIQCQSTSGDSLARCENCGCHAFLESDDDGEIREVDGMAVCEQCYRDSYSCDHCGGATFETLEVSGLEYCQSCADYYATPCSCCGDLIPANGEVNCELCQEDLDREAEEEEEAEEAEAE